jgi:hypothetical protein
MAISAKATSDQKQFPLARDPLETYALCSRVKGYNGPIQSSRILECATSICCP